MKRMQVFSVAALALVLLSTPSLPASAQEDREGRDLGRVLFVGESTTTHLRSRGLVPAEQILTTRQGTMMLSPRIAKTPVIEPISGRETPLSDAISERRPELLVLSFGLNGIAGFLREESRYLAPYRALIREVRSRSPKTKIILQTVYPVAEHPAEWNFSASPEEINRGIARLNRLLPILAQEEGVAVADTASALPDERGFLRDCYSADGIHLTKEGYEAVLTVLKEKILQENAHETP